jgi:hypothetical protein
VTFSQISEGGYLQKIADLLQSLTSQIPEIRVNFNKGESGLIDEKFLWCFITCSQRIYPCPLSLQRMASNKGMGGGWIFREKKSKRRSSGVSDLDRLTSVKTVFL